MLDTLDPITLPPMAGQIAANFLATRYGASFRSDGARVAWERMQVAYVRYVAAYEVAYPAEAGRLPDAWKGQRLPEFAAFRAAQDEAERLSPRG